MRAVVVLQYALHHIHADAKYDVDWRVGVPGGVVPLGRSEQLRPRLHFHIALQFSSRQDGWIVVGNREQRLES